VRAWARPDSLFADRLAHARLRSGSTAERSR
jgi:hypothetical protein